MTLQKIFCAKGVTTYPFPSIHPGYKSVILVDCYSFLKNTMVIGRHLLQVLFLLLALDLETDIGKTTKQQQCDTSYNFMPLLQTIMWSGC